MSVTARAKEIRRQITELEDELATLKDRERNERLDAFNEWSKKHYGKVLRKGDMFIRPQQPYVNPWEPKGETYWKVTCEAFVSDGFPFPVVELAEVGPRGGAKIRKVDYLTGKRQVKRLLTKTDLKRYKIKS